MADDDKTVPEFYDDVPRSTAIVRSRDETTALARKMAGEELPNECRFSCITCGWNKTLRFEDAEIAALGGDIASYGGPCGDCGSMTLIPYAQFLGDDMGTIYATAKKQRLEEARESADVLVSRLKEEVVGVMSGGTLFDGPAQDPGAEDVHDPAGHGFPDAADVATGPTKPRE